MIRHAALWIDPRNTQVTSIGAVCMGGFFPIAWIYRFLLKGAALIYWPLLLFHAYRDDADIRERNKADFELAKGGIPVLLMAALGGLASQELLGRQGWQD